MEADRHAASQADQSTQKLQSTADDREEVAVKPRCENARFSSTGEIGACIHEASPIFHMLYSPVGLVAPEILSKYDEANTEAALDGFVLRPNTIIDMESCISLSTHVYAKWIQHSIQTGNGEATAIVSYAETTGRFQLNTNRPGPLACNTIVDKTSVQEALRSLADVALNEAVKRHLIEGGDERLHLAPVPSWSGEESGSNKYFCPPYPAPPGTIVRSSCTCSPPSLAGFEAARTRLWALWNGNESAESAFGDVRRRIAVALGIQTRHHAVLHPSGTDAEFTALLVGLRMAQRQGCTEVVSIVVGAKEVGSNTAVAASGRHFSAWLPVGSEACDGKMAGLGLAHGSAAIGSDSFCDGVRVVELAARRDDGTVVPDFHDQVLEALEAATRRATLDGQNKPFFIVHAVNGSKLGSRITSHTLVEQIQSRYGEAVLFVLDACQARTDTHELDWYLARGAVVLITASKFYGAPGFCAAALVPQATAVVSQLIGIGTTAASDQQAAVVGGLGSYITQLEVPAELAALRSALPRRPANVGLLLRWSSGLAEMERFARLGMSGRQAICQWVHRVRGLIRERAPRLQLLGDNGCVHVNMANEAELPAAPSFVGGVNSIVSFGVRGITKAGEARQALLGLAALRQLHEWLTMDVRAWLPASASDAERQTAETRCYVGQPVNIGGFAVLRLAVGASMASDIAEDKQHLDDALTDDDKTLDKILLVVKYRGVFGGRKI